MRFYKNKNVLKYFISDTFPYKNRWFESIIKFILLLMLFKTFKDFLYY